MFAAATRALPLAIRRGLWGVSIWASAFLAAALLLPPAAGFAPIAAVPAALGVWVAAAVLALPVLRQQR